MTGEQFTCPVCGAKTEVYSRITGYYRPVQNWNDGKAQEYKDRRVYNIGHSVLSHTGPNPAPVDEPLKHAAKPSAAESIPGAGISDKVIWGMKSENAFEQAESVFIGKVQADAYADKTVSAQSASDKASQAILFKTPTCPNCRAASAILDKAGVRYTALNANEEKQLVEKYGVKQAPTLVLVNGDTIEKFRGVSDIKGWLMKR